MSTQPQPDSGSSSGEPVLSSSFKHSVRAHPSAFESVRGSQPEGPICANISFSKSHSSDSPPVARNHRPRRSCFRELKRPYKCGWDGCEKAYETVRHLNTHITMQSHGPNRIPEGALSLLNSLKQFPPYFLHCIRVGCRHTKLETVGCVALSVATRYFSLVACTPNPGKTHHRTGKD